MRCALPGAGLLTAPLRAAAVGARMAANAAVAAVVVAENTTLLGESLVSGISQTVDAARADLGALARAAAGMAVEAVGGPPARRCSTNADRHWIEVRGLGGEHGSAIAADVLAAVPPPSGWGI